MRWLIQVGAVLCLTVLIGCSETGAPGSGVNGGSRGSVDDPTSEAFFETSVGDRIFFAIDESVLNVEARNLLNGQATWLKGNTEYTVIIEGHADEQGTREYNLALGARRANAVREYLIDSGVSGDRIRTLSYGKERPVELCSLERCYAQNRRGVTVLNNVGF